MNAQLNEIKTWYSNGEVFAYPTEAVFGLGCDPLNRKAVFTLLGLKNRAVEKGLILVASEFSQIEPYVLLDQLSLEAQQTILASWPGPVTWLLPKSGKTPSWISGDSTLVAVRLSAHLKVREICAHIDKPIVSTSANTAGKAPALTEQNVKMYFGDQVHIVSGELGDQDSPSRIINSLTMETLRA